MTKDQLINFIYGLEWLSHDKNILVYAERIVVGRYQYIIAAWTRDDINSILITLYSDGFRIPYEKIAITNVATDKLLNPNCLFKFNNQDSVSASYILRKLEINGDLFKIAVEKLKLYHFISRADMKIEITI